VLLPSVRLRREHITRRAADIIPTHHASRALATVIERSLTRRAYQRSDAGIDGPAGSNAAGGRHICFVPATDADLADMPGPPSGLRPATGARGYDRTFSIAIIVA